MFPTIDKQRTGDRIRMLMKQQNITVKQIQEYLNLSCVQGIYHWLDGTSKHKASHPYHQHGRANTLRQAVRSIKGHDKWQLGGSKKV